MTFITVCCIVIYWFLGFRQLSGNLKTSKKTDKVQLMFAMFLFYKSAEATEQY